MSTKRRGHHEGTIKQRTDGRWEAQISLPGGKRKSYYGRTRREAQDKLRAGLRDLDAGLDLRTERQTLAQFLDRWLADVVQPTLAVRTHAGYADICRLHLTPTLGHLPLTKLTAQDVTRLLQAKRTGGLSPRSVQYIRSVLRGALNQAVRWQLIARNPVTLTDAPKVRRPEVRPLTPEQARAFLAAAEGDRLEALYRVALALGLRLGEALGLAWEDVDLATRTLRVRRALQRVKGRGLVLKEPKTEKSRRALVMPATLVAALRAHRVRQLEQRLAAGERWRDTGLVFTNRVGGPLEPATTLKRFQALLARAGLPKQRFHDLRHGAASLLLAQGVPAKVVADILGHTHISTTMDLYSHVMPAAHREAADLMDRILSAEG